jgi:peptide/nickel transport system permease protein
MQLLRQQLGLDLPLPLQFWRWLQQLLSGDLGRSIRTGQPIAPLLFERLQLSLVVIAVAVGLATLLAVPAGMLAAWRQNSFGDLAITIVATLLLSIPSYWLGLLLLLVFGLQLGWLPVVGFLDLSQDPSRSALFLVLPIATLVLIEFGALTRMARASTIEVLRLEYVAHARAKGLSEAAVLLRHVLPNAFGPTLTMIGLVIGQLLAGMAVLETVFLLPGFGRLLVDSIFARDYPVIQACMLATALFFVAVNLAVDLLYPFFDPRVAAD